MFSMKEIVIRLMSDYARARVIVEPDSECLTWTGMISAKGTPVTRVQPTKEKSHPAKSAPKYTWELVHGELEQGGRLRNICGNKLCVNPYHYEPYSKRCVNGHELTPDTTKTWTAHTTNAKGEKGTYRHSACRVCINEFPRKMKQSDKIALSNY